MKQVDLVGKIGSKGVVSEVVNGKRSISKSSSIKSRNSKTSFCCSVESLSNFSRNVC